MNSIRSFLLISFFLILSVMISCHSTKEITEHISDEEPGMLTTLEMLVDTSTVFNSNVTGFVLFDPETDSTIYSLNGSKYFTPASNTKLFTFYAGLKALSENLRALEYITRGDSLNAMTFSSIN